MSRYAKLDFSSCDGIDDPLLSYILGSTKLEVIDHALKERDLVLSEFRYIYSQLRHA